MSSSKEAFFFTIDRISKIDTISISVPCVTEHVFQTLPSRYLEPVYCARISMRVYMLYRTKVRGNLHDRPTIPTWGFLRAKGLGYPHLNGPIF